MEVFIPFWRNRLTILHVGIFEWKCWRGKHQIGGQLGKIFKVIRCLSGSFGRLAPCNDPFCLVQGFENPLTQLSIFLCSLLADRAFCLIGSAVLPDAGEWIEE